MEKEEKKRKTPQTCKSPTQRQRFITTIKTVTAYMHIHIHIHPQAKSKQFNKNKVQQTDPAKKGNQKLYILEEK